MLIKIFGNRLFIGTYDYGRMWGILWNNKSIISYIKK